MKLLKRYALYAIVLTGSLQASDNDVYQIGTLLAIVNLQQHVQCIREDYQNGFFITPRYYQQQLAKAIELDNQLQIDLSHKHIFTNENKYEKINSKFIAIISILEEILTNDHQDQRIRQALHTILDYRPGTGGIEWINSVKRSPA